MRMLAITCLATLVVMTSLAEPVEAARRRRRARRTVAAAGVVAVATRRPRAVAPVIVAAPAVVQRPSVALTPDLTITEIVVEGDLHCITVKNIGQTTSPETRLRIDFRRVVDGAEVLHAGPLPQRHKLLIKLAAEAVQKLAGAVHVRIEAPHEL